MEDEEFAVVCGATVNSFGFNVLVYVVPIDGDSDTFKTVDRSVLCDHVPVVETSDKAEIVKVNVEGVDVGVMFVTGTSVSAVEDGRVPEDVTFVVREAVLDDTVGLKSVLNNVDILLWVSVLDDIL